MTTRNLHLAHDFTAAVVVQTRKGHYIIESAMHEFEDAEPFLRWIMFLSNCSKCCQAACDHYDSYKISLN